MFGDHDAIQLIGAISGNLKKYFPVYVLGIVTAANANGTYNVNIKGRDYVYEEVTYIGTRQLFDGDTVLVGFYQGDRQMPVIIDFSGLQSSKSVAEYIINPNLVKWPNPTTQSAFRNFGKNAAFEEDEEPDYLINEVAKALSNPPNGISMMDDDYAYHYVNNAVYRLNVKGTDTISVNTSEAILGFGNLTPLGVNHIYLYYQTVSTPYKIICIKKETLSVKNSVTAPDDAYFATFGCEGQKVHLMYLSYDGLLGIYRLKIRIYNLDLIESNDYEPAMYRYISGGPYAFGGVGSDFLHIANVGYLHSSGYCMDNKRSYYGITGSNKKRGTIYPSESTTQWLYGTPQTIVENAFDEDVNFMLGVAPPQSLANNDYIAIAFRPYAARIVCINKETEEIQWNLNGGVTIAQVYADEVLMDSGGYYQSKAAQSYRYIASYESFRLLCMTPDYLYVEKRTVNLQPVVFEAWTSKLEGVVIVPPGIPVPNYVAYHYDEASMLTNSLTHTLLKIHVSTGDIVAAKRLPIDYYSTADRYFTVRNQYQETDGGIVYNRDFTITYTVGQTNYYGTHSSNSIFAARGDNIYLNRLSATTSNTGMEKHDDADFSGTATISPVASQNQVEVNHYDYALIAYNMLAEELLWQRLGGTSDYFNRMLIIYNELYCWHVQGAAILPYDLLTGTNKGIIAAGGLIPENYVSGKMDIVGHRKIVRNDTGQYWHRPE